MLIVVYSCSKEEHPSGQTASLPMFGFVGWVVILVVCTAVPIVLDLARSFLPHSMRLGRLVQAWQRPVLIAMVCGLCVFGYAAFWSSILPYSVARDSIEGKIHIAFATVIWLNTVVNYALCAAVDPGVVGESSTGRWCEVCRVRVQLSDHHCPFTGGCVGRHNFHHFILFLLHAWLGGAYACFLCWWPFRDCVWRQLVVPPLGWQRSPPPNEAACVKLATRSLLLLPTGALWAAVGCLGALHALLLANGLTTLQFVRSWRSRGRRALRDLLLLRSEAEVDKWALLWGRTEESNTALRRLRVLLLPGPPRGALPLGQKALLAGLLGSILLALLGLCIGVLEVQ